MLSVRIYSSVGRKAHESFIIAAEEKYLHKLENGKYFIAISNA